MRADAFALPFRDGTFDVVMADPPYEGRGRGKQGVRGKDVGYIFFSGRGWWHEAWRVLTPSGWLYLFCAVPELRRWLVEIPEAPRDVIAWHAPNFASRIAMWRRKVATVRAPLWRPILCYQRPPHVGNLVWAGQWADGNYLAVPAIQSMMHEALPWPNQLPERLVQWLLRPHVGARVLDLFCGTGTTRAAALGLGLSVVSVDLSREALAITQARPIQRGWAFAGPSR